MDHDLREGPLQMRVSDFSIASPYGFAPGTPLGFDQSTIGGKSLGRRKAANRMNFIKKGISQDAPNARDRLEECECIGVMLLRLVQHLSFDDMDHLVQNIHL